MKTLIRMILTLTSLSLLWSCGGNHSQNLSVFKGMDMEYVSGKKGSKKILAYDKKNHDAFLWTKSEGWVKFTKEGTHQLAISILEGVSALQFEAPKAFVLNQLSQQLEQTPENEREESLRSLGRDFDIYPGTVSKVKRGSHDSSEEQALAVRNMKLEKTNNLPDFRMLLKFDLVKLGSGEGDEEEGNSISEGIEIDSYDFVKGFIKTEWYRVAHQLKLYEDQLQDRDFCRFGRSLRRNLATPPESDEAIEDLWNRTFEGGLSQEARKSLEGLLAEREVEREERAARRAQELAQLLNDMAIIVYKGEEDSAVRLAAGRLEAQMRYQMSQETFDSEMRIRVIALNTATREAGIPHDGVLSDEAIYEVLEGLARGRETAAAVAAAEDHGDAAAEDHGDAAAEDHGDAAAEDHGDAAAEDHGEGVGDHAAEGDDDDAPQPMDAADFN